MQARSTGRESKRVESGMEIPTKPGDTLLMNNTTPAVHKTFNRNMNNIEIIEIIRISSCDLPMHPAYVARDLRQVQKVCELIGTEDTVWSQEQIDTIGRRDLDRNLL